jgi:hypothetical protein
MVQQCLFHQELLAHLVNQMALGFLVILVPQVCLVHQMGQAVLLVQWVLLVQLHHLFLVTQVHLIHHVYLALQAVPCLQEDQKDL